jgi:hypothetical protein
LDFRRAALADLALVDISTDQQTDSQAWTETLKIADLFQLALSEEISRSQRSIKNSVSLRPPSVCTPKAQNAKAQSQKFPV